MPTCVQRDEKEIQLPHVLAIDQGTTSSRAILFRADLTVTASAQQELQQHYPQPGWVEHDPDDIWRGVLSTCREVMVMSGVRARDIAAIGIANQRETTVIWDRTTGMPIHRAIVWQDRRTADLCHRLKAAGFEDTVRAKTGLLLDPYFSATKIAWLLDCVPGARAQAERGDLAFGTIDTFLLWRLTGGAVHATDATNAARTLLYDIHANAWSPELCALFGVPMSVLPEVRDCAADFGTTAPDLLGGAIPIRGIAGDQQAALIGQACFAPGMMKSTYGTGCFAVLNTGRDAVASNNRLLTTIGYRLAGETTYALEGSIFIAGAAVQWLRDGLALMATAAHAGPMAEAADPEQDVIMVPAFTGLGAPYWDSEARGAIFGLTRGTGRNEFARAALEAVCFQTHDLLAAMRADWAGGLLSPTRQAGGLLSPTRQAGGLLSPTPRARGLLSPTRLTSAGIGGFGGGSAHDTVLRVDGGMAASDWTMQRLADLLGVPVDRPTVLETTALGAAYLAGLQSGLYPVPELFAQRWALDRRFIPRMAADERIRRVALWTDAVARTLSARKA